ncbi:MAG: S4 domain-containing protein [Flavobacteriaceae bacterium]|nr:S4 domain-containing protein [Flavobacteriaceae bacterium]
MRIDQYLWFIRLFKSRNIALNACKKGQVFINDQTVKASREVLPLDQIKVRKDQIWRQIEVIALPKSRVGAKLVGLYCIERIDNLDAELNKMQQLASHANREPGSGRPTKKERRELDDLSKEDLIED